MASDGLAERLRVIAVRMHVVVAKAKGQSACEEAAVADGGSQNNGDQQRRTTTARAGSQFEMDQSWPADLI